MAVASMKIVNIAGPMSMFDEVARITVTSSSFAPEDALSFYRNNKYFMPMPQDNPYAAPAERLSSTVPRDCAFDTGVEPLDEENKNSLIEQAVHFSDRMSSFASRRDSLEARAVELYAREKMLSHFVGLNLNMKEISALEYTSVRFGRMTKDCFARLNERDRAQKLFAFRCTDENPYTYCVIFSPKSYAKDMDRILSGLNFERIFVPETDTTVESRHEMLLREIEDVEKQIEENERCAREMFESEKDRISSILAALKEESSYCDMKKYAAVYEDKFILIGWVPAHSGGKKLIKTLQSLQNVDVVSENADSEKEHNPPVLLRNPRLVKPFEMFVDMYGMPSYGEFDPTPFVAFTYILLFGIMFGDLGQGLLVSLVGYLMWKFKKMPLGRILIRCGVSSAVFGCVFGSVFGFEHVLDPVYKALFGIDGKPIEVMEAETTNMIIYAAVGIGIVLVALAMLINIVSCIRRRDKENLLFGANGIPGFVFYCSLVYGLVQTMLFGNSVMNGLYIIFLIALPLVLIFLKEPLGALAEGRKEKIEWGNYLAQSFFELFETLLSYVTNTMSFLRVGAFVLVHAGMMMVVFTLAEMASGAGYVIVVVAGNIIVSALEGLLVGIQVLRLEFYEMFSRFFDGGGRPFIPAGRKEV